jgi:hypothetical protein
MMGEKRIDGLSTLVYVVYDLVLDENEENVLISNSIKGVNTYGPLKIKAKRTSEVDLPKQDEPLQDYLINTVDITEYELKK